MRSDLLFRNRPDVDAFCVFSPVNRFYLTGFKSSSGCFATTKTSRVFYTDGRYSEAAEEVLTPLGFELFFGKDEEFFEHLRLRFLQEGVKTVCIEDQFLSFHAYANLKEQLKEFKIIPLGRVIDEIRMIKTPEEIDNIRNAESISCEALQKVIPLIKAGISELDIAIELEYRMKKLGSGKMAFETIVASGANTSKPHAVPSNKKIAMGEMVLLDFGASYQGYCADMTRTLCVGKNQNEQLKFIYDVVLQAQNYALEHIKAGMTCREADSYAREYITANGYGKEFTHSLGHGVGLDIHELPKVSQSDDTLLAENMVISVEPGIYVRGLGGVRIEDLVVVKNDGITNLTTFHKEWNIL